MAKFLIIFKNNQLTKSAHLVQLKYVLMSCPGIGGLGPLDPTLATPLNRLPQSNISLCFRY